MPQKSVTYTGIALPADSHVVIKENNSVELCEKPHFTVLTFQKPKALLFFLIKKERKKERTKKRKKGRYKERNVHSLCD
jgi:hypothetical protein